jgi:hypothetical protein
MPLRWDVCIVLDCRDAFPLRDKAEAKMTRRMFHHSPSRTVRQLWDDAVDSENQRRSIGWYTCFRPVRVEAKEGSHFVSAFCLALSLHDVQLLHWYPLACKTTRILFVREGGPVLDFQIRVVTCEAIGDGWYLTCSRFLSVDTATDPSRIEEYCFGSA